jgi:hypothetical protein
MYIKNVNLFYFYTLWSIFILFFNLILYERVDWSFTLQVVQNRNKNKILLDLYNLYRDRFFGITKSF